MPSAERIAMLINAYTEGPRLVAAAVRGLSTDELHFTPAPGHWSIHQNVVHLADADLVAAARLRHVLAEPGVALVAFDQEQWGRALDYAGRSLEASLALLRAVRETTADLLRRMPPEAWTRTGQHTREGAQTVEGIVAHFVEHVDHHLRTIATRRRQYAETRAQGGPRG
ncbi:MAG: DinB family protein [Armatimonadota bacterium]|nr:DinB family protein [Armatimonadota bacterium]MDR7534979.1 DinB family protein [Armatimonadota bacterium]